MPIKLACFLVVIALGQMLLGLALNAWQSWMADLVPGTVRGRYFGTRGALVSATGMIVGYGGAWLIDRSTAVGLAAPAYASLLILAAACGGLGSLLLARQPEPAMQRSTSLCLSALLTMPLRNPRFRRFAGTFMLWQVALGVASPFMIAYGLTALRLPLHMLALTETLTALTSVLAQPYWGKLADRIGQRHVLRLCMVLVVPMPWMWVLSTPTWIWPLLVGALLSGIAWSGIAVTQMSRLMEQTPADGQCSYFAAFAVATGVPFMLASFGAGALMSVIGTETVTVLGSHVHPYIGFFVASSVLRFVTVMLGWKAL
jgi:MFS family permease